MTDAYEIDPDDPHRPGAPHGPTMRSTGEAMVPVMSGAAGNAADFVVRAGIPAVYYGCDYASAHSDREWTTVEELARVASAFALASAVPVRWRRSSAPPLADA